MKLFASAFVSRHAGSAALMSAMLFISAGLAGCGVSGNLPTNDVVNTANVSGTVYGGQNPISGATLQLYSVGTTGYGTGATALGGTATSNSKGQFNLASYSCPSSSTLIYLTATGGNPGLGTGTNSNSVLAVLLGQCGNVNSTTQIGINEQTTIAAAYALAQYFTTTYGTGSTDGFGSPSTAQALTGMTNAFTTAATLVNSATGQPNATLTTNGAGGTITITPEAAKLATLADILAACVNSAGGVSGDGSSCGTLFADVAPAGVTPTDTLQAAVLLNLNPTSNQSTANMTALYGLISSTPPYTAQASQPTDWTLGIQYAGTSSTMADPQSLVIDAGGNVWVANNNNSAGGSLNEITPGGSMAVFSTVATTVGSTAVSLVVQTPRNLAIDLNGNVYIPTSTGSGYLFEYTAAGTSLAVTVGKSPYGIAIDASNNVWVGEESSSTTHAFAEFLGGTLAAASQVSYPASTSTAVMQPSYMAFDANGVLWASSGANPATSTNIVQITGTSSASCTSFPCTTGAATYNNVAPLPTEPYGLAASANAMIVADSTPTTPGISSVTLTSPAVTTYGSTQSILTPRFPAVDGAGNIWTSNNKTGSLSEFSGSGTVLSPQPTSPNTAPVGFVHGGISGGQGLGIDPSGNVWVADNTTTGAQAYSVFEIVGAAAPTVTPLVAALKNGTIGKKP